MFTAVRPGDSLPSFSDVSVADVLSAIARLPNKSSATDPLTVPLMKAVAVEQAPFQLICCPRLQYGFRPHHSTETATLRVLSDILTAIDSGDVAALVLRDLSAAFDAVDHSILCRRLNSCLVQRYDGSSRICILGRITSDVVR